jgi:hypothetical protein
MLCFTRLTFGRLVSNALDLGNISRVALEVLREPAAHLFKVYIHRAK